jgi:hypothetical protein
MYNSVLCLGDSGGADGMIKLNRKYKRALVESAYFILSVIILTALFSYLLIGAFI